MLLLTSCQAEIELLGAVYQSIEGRLSEAQRKMFSLRRAHFDLELAFPRFLKDIFLDVAETVMNIRKGLDIWVNPTSSFGFWESVAPRSCDFYLRMTGWIGLVARDKGTKEEVEMTKELGLWVKRAYDDKCIDSQHENVINKIMKVYSLHDLDN
jgi:hypothetical protein